MSKDFLTVDDISNEFNLSKRKIRELFRNGKIKGRKIGNKYITTKKFLSEYIEASDDETIKKTL